MTILLDVDGVIADLAGAFCTHAHVPLAKWTHWDLSRCYDPAVAAAFHAYLQRPDLYNNVQAYPGAKQFVQHLRELGRVVACTAPYMAHASSKAQWLQKHFRFKAHDIVLAADKTLVRGSTLVEDRTDKLVQWCEVHSRPGILLCRQWNTNPNHPQVYVADGYSQAVQLAAFATAR